MNSRQISLFNMYLRVQKVLDQYKTIWSSNTKFTANHKTFELNMAAITREQQKQETDNKGVKKSKISVRESMIDKAVYITKAVKSYAADENHQVLYENLNYSRSELEKLPDVQFIAACNIIAEKVEPHMANLDEYGVQADHLKSFKDIISTFNSAQPSVQTAKGVSKSATDSLPDLFTATGSLLKKQMDGKMEQYKEVYPDFYNEYFNARNIIDPATRPKNKETEKVA